MFRSLALAAVLLAPLPALAQVDTGRVIDAHVLPRYETLADRADTLETVAQDHCAPGDTALRDAYGAAFDAWIGVSHLRFGPSEEEDRAFALAFWPDTRGATPKALAGLIADEDAVVSDMAEFATVSIAARGFYALEFLLYDETISATGTDAYRCALVQAIATDISRIADAILADWTGGFADTLRDPGSSDRYRTPEEAAQELFKALTTGLQFTSDARLGRPLGTFDRPRPNRAEARRAGRSLRHVILSLEATRELAALLAEGAPQAAEDLDAAFAAALDEARGLTDPVFAGITDPVERLKVEIVQQRIDQIRTLAALELGPELGIAAGFNALDGD